jgi:ribosomal-protein-serine acetyltransferase
VLTSHPRRLDDRRRRRLPPDRSGQPLGQVGYWLDEQRQANGIATRAVRAACQHAFSTWGLNRVEIRVAVENSASQKLAERLSFTREDVLRQAQIVNGVALDLAVYSLLAGESAL